MNDFATPRLRMRPPEAGDEALFLRLYTDPALMRHVGAPLSPEAVGRGFRTACRQAGDVCASARRWIITERASGTDIGVLGLHRHDGADPTAELGVMLLAQWQGRGLGAEALAGLVDVAFDALRLSSVCTRHAAGNDAVERMMLKLGFRRGDSAQDIAAGQCRWRMDHAAWDARGDGADGFASVASGR